MDFALEDCFFGAVKVTKNADIDKCNNSGYGIGFDSRGTFLIPSAKFGQNVILFSVVMISSVHVDTKKKDILILDEGSTRGLYYITRHYINCTKKVFN